MLIHLPPVKRWPAIAAVAALAVAPTLVPAQEQEIPEANSGNLEFSIGADVVTAYYFRGYEQEDSGFIIQPDIEVTAGLYEGDGFITGVSIFASAWNSFHGEETLAGPESTVDSWYETDLSAGMSVEFGERFTGTIAYIGYFYPNDAFEPIHELDFSLEFNDAGLYDSKLSDDDTAPALYPYVLVAWEVDDKNGDENIYLELGAQPGIVRTLTEDYDVALTFPLRVGLSLDEYYVDANGDDEFFGFASAGVLAEVPLPIPAEYGSWNLHAGVDVLYLNDDASLNDTGDEWEVIGLIGVGLTY